MQIALQLRRVRTRSAERRPRLSASRRARGLRHRLRHNGHRPRYSASRAEAQRITAAAQAAEQAASRRGPGERGLNAHEIGRTSVIIFFNGELAAATTGFADSHCIGGGGFGRVFFTVPLRWMRGAELAIKKLDLESMQGKTEFLQEVQVLGACRHVNLTPLLGFAADSTRAEFAS